MFELSPDIVGYGNCEKCGYYLDEIPLTGEVLPDGNGGCMFPIVQPFTCFSCDTILLNVHRTNPELLKLVFEKVEIDSEIERKSCI